MNKWKKIVNRPLIDNTKMQTGGNQVGHHVMTFLLFPLMVIGFSIWLVAASLAEDMLIDSIFGLVGLLFTAIIGYSYYFPKSFKIYFYIIFAAPAILGIIFFIVCLFLRFF